MNSFNSLYEKYADQEESENSALNDYRLMYKSMRRLRDSIQLQEEEKLSFLFSCKDLETPDAIYEDATEMAQDLGYYATFDDLEDPEDSNWKEIDYGEFSRHCNIPDDIENIMQNEIGLFLKHKKGKLYCFYSDEYDTHYFWE